MAKNEVSCVDGVSVAVCPTIEALSSEIKKNVKCPVTGCEKIFNHDNSLRMHVVKTHKIFKDEKDCAFFNRLKTEKLPYCYHCPAEGCKYQKGMDRHFPSYQSLRQHFKIVHMEKKYICDDCGRKFSVESALRRHSKTCGVVYKCETCRCPYATREALLTHCRRNRHVVPETYRPTRSQVSVPNVGGNSKPSTATSMTVSSQNNLGASCQKNTLVGAGRSSRIMREIPHDHKEGDVDQDRLNCSARVGKDAVCVTHPSMITGNETGRCSLVTDVVGRDKAHDGAPGTQIERHVKSHNVGTGSDQQCQALGGQHLHHVEAQNDQENVKSGDQSVTVCGKQNAPAEKEPELNECSASPPSLGVTLCKRKSNEGYSQLAKKTKGVSENVVQPVVNLYVFSVNADTAGMSAVKSVIEQTSKLTGMSASHPGHSRPVPILPKPPEMGCDPVVVDKTVENRLSIDVVNDAQGISKTSSVVQTSVDPIDKTSSQTQTTGDYVLMKAMQSANIPIQKESRGAQVSPRSRVRGAKRTIPTQTTSVQTGSEIRPVVRRKRRKKQPKGSEGATACASTSFSQATSPPLTVSDFFDLGFSDNETQTIAMIEELEASLAASISTQTRESFLANPGTEQSTPQTPLSMQTIETQTLTVETGCDASEGFSLLNFLNSAESSSDNRSSGVQTPSLPQLPSFDQPMPLDNPIDPSGADLPLVIPVAQPQPLNTGASLFDASAQTTEISAAIQTQTIDSMFSQLLSNMETQTSDDIPILEFESMDNETQTPFDIDMMGSQANVETQTALHNSVQNSNNVQSIDTETQTLFPDLTSTDSHTQTSLADLEKFMNL